MPPKKKITKEDIIETALEIVRENGMGALNARALAKKLSCSTQPVFSNYSSMEDLQEDVLQAADRLYQRYLEKGMKDPAYPPYKASGMAYIRFAKEEKELFRLLFMRDRTGEEVREDRESIAGLLELVASNMGISQDAAYMFHLEMWIYVHGIAVMVATSYLDWDWEMISEMMTDAYQGMRERYQKKEKN